MKILYSFLFFFIFSGLKISAQSPAPVSASKNDTAQYPYWIAMMQDPTINFFRVQRAFNLYWKDRPVTKGCGWKPFKRWEYMMMNRIHPDGTRPSPDEVFHSYMTLKQGVKSSNGNWVSHGPADIPAPGPAGYEGLGRLNVVAFHPTDANKIYVGSPSGGMWQSANGGGTWVSYTDDLPTLGVSAILVVKNNPDIIFIGTGDRDAGDAAGMGVFRSTNGGVSWSAFNNGMGNVTVGKIIQHPADNQVLIAATNGGVYRSANGGADWILSYSGNFKDVLFKPGNPGIVYAAGGPDFFRSSDGGVTFTQVTEGLSGGQRAAMAVSANNPAFVYLLVSDDNSGFKGLYRSTDSGLSFALQSSSPNILDWSCDGSGTGGQGWYDLAIEANPNNANEIFVGGVDVWKSSDGGVTWTINSHWYGGCSVPAAHADCHFLGYSPVDGKLYAGNDGGIYITSNGGTTWTDRTVGLTIGQIYKVGQSQTDRNKMINGFQDNGTYTHLSTGWVATGGGDGMECAVDYQNGAYTYHTIYFGDIFRRVNNNNEFHVAGNGAFGIDESGAWVTPFLLHKTNPNTMFTGYKNIWRGVNIRTNSPTWTKISNNLGGNNGTDLAVLEQSPANTSILYAARYDNMLFRTDNCMDLSPTWTDLTANLPVIGTPSDIEAHPTDPNTVYMTMGNSIYKSTDKGLTWTDISINLTGIHLNSVAYYKNSAEGLYVASDAGVYYKDQSLSTWIMFSQGLPANGRVTEVEIFYDNDSVTRDAICASTYGRGLWQSDMYRTNPQCPSPADLTATDITNVAATLDWTESGSATTWNIELGLAGFLPTGTPTMSGVTKPYVYDGLSPLTSYSYYVQSCCSPGNFSVWKGPFTFTTICYMTPLPYSQQFSTSSWPTCWTHQESGGATPTLWSVSNSSNAGGSPFEMYLNWMSADPAIARIVTPQLMTSGITQLNVTFRHYFDDWGPGVTMKLQSSPDGITWTDAGFTIASGYGNYGPALVTVPVPTNGNLSTYLAWTAEGNLYQYDAWFIDNIEITGLSSSKTLTSKVILEGLYNPGTGMMNKTQDVTPDGIIQTDKWESDHADTLSVLLAGTTDPWPIVFQAHGLYINTNGTISIPEIPSSLTGNYYIVIKHRQSVETWSAEGGVSFSGSSINYDFSSGPGQAFGNNMKRLDESPGYYGLWGGDISGMAGTQDGYVDIYDNNSIFNSSQNGEFGYLTEDLTGDGYVDIFDLVQVFNNMQYGAGMITPPNPGKKK